MSMPLLKAAVVRVLVMIVLMTSIFLLDATSNKVPARITHVYSMTPIPYVVLQTHIYNNKTVGKGAHTVTEDENDDEASPSEGLGEQRVIITRTQLDIVGPNHPSSNVLDVKLELPMPPVEIDAYGATKVLDKVGKFVGTVGLVAAPDPSTKVAAMLGGVAISGVAALADYATFVAEQELAKLYENQSFKISFLELGPRSFYTYDATTHKVIPTSLFWTESERYNAAADQYIKALKEYQDANSIYTQWYDKLVALDPAGTKKEQWALLRDYDNNTVQPLLDIKNKQENQFAKLYPPYRMVIMAGPVEVGNTCGGFGSGPWELHIIYYVGARQVNQIAVKYCVPNPKAAQTFMVELISNGVQQIDTLRKQQQFIPGGIRIKAISNATFSQSTGFQEGNYGATATATLTWFTENIISDEDALTFMVPFDLYALRAGVTQELKKVQSAKLKGILDSMDTLIERTEDIGQKQADMQEQEQKTETAQTPEAAEQAVDKPAGDIPVDPQKAAVEPLSPEQEKLQEEKRMIEQREKKEHVPVPQEHAQVHKEPVTEVQKPVPETKKSTEKPVAAPKTAVDRWIGPKWQAAGKGAVKGATGASDATLDKVLDVGKGVVDKAYQKYQGYKGTKKQVEEPITEVVTEQMSEQVPSATQDVKTELQEQTSDLVTEIYEPESIDTRAVSESTGTQKKPTAKPAGKTKRARRSRAKKGQEQLKSIPAGQQRPRFDVPERIVPERVPAAAAA